MKLLRNRIKNKVKQYKKLNKIKIKKKKIKQNKNKNKKLKIKKIK